MGSKRFRKLGLLRGQGQGRRPGGVMLPQEDWQRKPVCGTGCASGSAVTTGEQAMGRGDCTVGVGARGKPRTMRRGGRTPVICFQEVGGLVSRAVSSEGIKAMTAAQS